MKIQGGTQQYWAHIFRGAFHYYYKDILELKRPPLNQGLKPQMKIGAFEKSGRANHQDDRRLLGIRNQIRMYNAFDEDEKDDIPAIQYKTNDFVATIIHELAHASHWELRKGDWDNGTDDIVQESWAVCVETYLTKKYFYSWYDTENSTFFDFKLIKTKDISEQKYTGYFIDLIDDYNQRYVSIGSNITFSLDVANDQVTGYSIKQIEDILKNCGSLDDVKTELKNTYVNVTDKYLYNLTEQYKNLKQILP